MEKLGIGEAFPQNREQWKRGMDIQPQYNDKGRAQNENDDQLYTNI